MFLLPQIVKRKSMGVDMSGVSNTYRKMKALGTNLMLERDVSTPPNRRADRKAQIYGGGYSKSKR